jgi:hypothetical protein
VLPEAPLVLSIRPPVLSVPAQPLPAATVTGWDRLVTTDEVHYRLRSPLPVTLRDGQVLQVGREPARGLLITAPPDPVRNGAAATGAGSRAAVVVLAALEHPRTLTDLRRLATGVPTPWLRGVLQRLCEAGLVLALDRPATARRVAVVGSGVLASTIAGLLGQGPVGLELVRLAADEPPAQRAPGVPSRPEALPLAHWSRCDPEWAELTVVATGTDEPDRALTDALLRRDRPHLSSGSNPAAAWWVRSSGPGSPRASAASIWPAAGRTRPGRGCSPNSASPGTTRRRCCSPGRPPPPAPRCWPRSTPPSPTRRAGRSNWWRPNT